MSFDIRMKSILLVDSNFAFLDLCGDLLCDRGYKVREFTTGTAAANHLSQAHNAPDLLLTDLVLACNSISGTDLITTTRSRAHLARLPIVVLSAYDTVQERTGALNAGADAFLSKPFEPEELLALIAAQLDRVARLAAIGVERQSPELVPLAHPLTKQQTRVLALVSLGQSNKIIARSLAVTQRTVEAHMVQIFEKLGCRNRTQAARWAIERRA